MQTVGVPRSTDLEPTQRKSQCCTRELKPYVHSHSPAPAVAPQCQLIRRRGCSRLMALRLLNFTIGHNRLPNSSSAVFGARCICLAMRHILDCVNWPVMLLVALQLMAWGVFNLPVHGSHRVAKPCSRFSVPGVSQTRRR